ncbi:hypothetical protein HZD82_24890 [Pantoea agglomerans]|nr:hypothetical protein [Pantoea agglomerans]
MFNPQQSGEYTVTHSFQNKIAVVTGASSGIRQNQAAEKMKELATMEISRETQGLIASHQTCGAPAPHHC